MMKRKLFALLLAASAVAGAFGYTVGNVPVQYFMFEDTNVTYAVSQYSWLTVNRIGSSSQLSAENPSLEFSASVSSPGKTVVGWGLAPALNARQVTW